MFHPLKVSLSVQLKVNSILTNHNARSSSVIVINTDEPEYDLGHTEEQILVFLAFLNSRCLGTLVLAPLVKIRRKASRSPKDYPHNSLTSKKKKLTRLKKN